MLVPVKATVQALLCKRCSQLAITAFATNDLGEEFRDTVVKVFSLIANCNYSASRTDLGLKLVIRDVLGDEHSRFLSRNCC